MSFDIYRQNTKIHAHFVGHSQVDYSASLKY